MDKKKRYFLEIAYRGTKYHGWQVQPKQVTVQKMVDHTLSTVFNEPIHVQGCGRTDTGVHASQFFLHFDATKAIPDNFLYRSNKFLPKDIAIKRLISDVPADAHARFDATYRAYHYFVHFQKDPFLFDQSFFFPWRPLDFETMQQAAKMLLDYNEFRMFCKSGHSSKTTLCNIFETQFTMDEANNRLVFKIAANRFLRGMVRRVMGCLLMMGKGKITMTEFKDVMDNQKPQFENMNISVPPQGLFLSEVRYNYL